MELNIYYESSTLFKMLVTLKATTKDAKRNRSCIADRESLYRRRVNIKKNCSVSRTSPLFQISFLIIIALTLVYAVNVTTVAQWLTMLCYCALGSEQKFFFLNKNNGKK